MTDTPRLSTGDDKSFWQETFQTALNARMLTFPEGHWNDDVEAQHRKQAMHTAITIADAAVFAYRERLSAGKVN